MADPAHDSWTQIAAAAAQQGFELVGVSPAHPLSDDLQALESWCAQGHGAELGYMTRNPPERADPETLLKGVRSVLSFAVNYYVPGAPFESAGRYGRVARYAWGPDYHEVLLPRLRTLARILEALLHARARVAVDHSPILERAWAVRGGLGFFGKNTCLLLPRRGSFYFLGEILCDAELPPTQGASDDHCGTCTTCLPACPTKAFPAPYVLDARRCISYLTIEHRGPIDVQLRAGLGAWVFGCDVCQDVCPFNRFATATRWPELDPARGVGPRLDLERTLWIRSDAEFAARFTNSPLLRPRRRGLLRNAAVAARNIGADACVPPLVDAVASDSEPLVRGHALWALAGLEPARARAGAQALSADPDPFVREEARRILDGASW